MKEAEMNVVFVSNRNVRMAYRIKRVFWKMNGMVLNMESFSNVFKILKELSNALIIVDGSTMEINNGIFQILRDCRNDENLSLLLIVPDVYSSSDYSISLKSKNNFYVIKESCLEQKIEELGDLLKLNLAQSNLANANLKQLNESLNSWLLQTGFITKHLGFTFIKEVIVQSVVYNFGMRSLSSKVYPIIALNHNTHVNTVERNIRNAITKATETQRFKQSEFAPLLQCGKLSNRTFMAYLLDKATAFLKYGC